MTHAIVLGGFGGQGVKVIASLLAQAAHTEGRHAAMYNIYAAAIRGGPIFCTVLVSDEPLRGGPVTTAPTSVLAMDPNTVTVYGPEIRAGGVLVVNTSLVRDVPPLANVTIVRAPTNEIAETIGDIRYTGMVGLGALIGATRVVGLDAVRSCLEQTLPSYRHHMIPANVDALQRGADCAGAVSAAAR